MKRVLFVLLAVVFGLAALIWWRIDSDSSARILDASPGPGHAPSESGVPLHNTADRAADNTSVLIDSGDANSEEQTQIPQREWPDSLAAAPDLESLIDRVAEHGEWDPMQTITNAAPWRVSCAAASKQKGPSPSGDAAPDAIGAFATRFDTFCNEFSLKQSVGSGSHDSADDIDGFLNQVSNGSWLITRQFPDWRRMLEQSGKTAVLKAAVDSLDQSLASLDEMGVASVLKFITDNGLVDPPIPDDSQDTSGLYRGVIGEAAAILFCEQIGGCNGPNHPVVLRQCVIRLDRGIGCHRPGGIHDAVHQTLTPLQHQAFLALLGQVRSLRGRHG